ncbi:PREDICTED: extracellular matrix-binding protein ebh-like [Nicrophorus vespilloides]|uniref:Extracellular matrix-binding protein ebh-like n=1 Tax=Nicrophorus vespilloides TaxID=110193 RepID=A0ABM1N6I0_NICVS|nr:PREDICTED: extracellular matrix-binding protein ebh-like [Nicrophorus vespilloides]
MGSSSSKASDPFPKKEKLEKLDDVRKSVRALHRELNEDNMRHGNDVYFSLLTKHSKSVQNIRASMKSKKSNPKCKEVLDEINDCIAILETKHNNRESNLDFGTVESNSFISQDLDRFPIVPETEPEEPKFEYRTRLHTMPEIERKINSLDIEIRRTVDLNDFKNYPLLEKKVKMLYDDLELVNPLPHTPLHEKKEKLADKLIKFRKKITVMQRRSMDLNFQLKPFQTDDLMTLIKIEQDLSDLEVRALTFEDTKENRSYHELSDNLRQNFATLSKLTITNDEGKKRISNAQSLVKKIIHELEKKVKENEPILKKEMAQLTAIENDIRSYKEQAEACQGNKDSTFYLTLDQKLKASKEKLDQMKGSSSFSRNTREHLLNEIQSIMNGLHEKITNTKPTSPLVDRLESFNVSWMNIERMIKNEQGVNNKEALNILRNIQISMANALDARRSSRIYSNQVMYQLVKEISDDNKKVDQVDLRKTPSIANSVMRIQLIDRGINELRDKLRNFTGTSDSETYDHFESQLLQYKSDLDAVDITKSGTLHKSKIKAMKDLHEVTQFLQEKAEKNDDDRGKSARVSIRNSRSQSCSAALEKIFTVESSARSFIPRIENYKGTREEAEFEEIQQKLNEFINLLVTLDVGRHENLHTSKMETLQLINKLQTNLCEVADKNDMMRTEELRRIKELLKRVHAVKKKIDCFTGTYKNIQYVQMEDELKYCKVKLDETQSTFKKVLDAKEKGSESIDRLLNILEERSIKADPPANSQQLIEKARNKLLEVKAQMENFNGKHKDEEYYRIINRLHACNDEVNAITMDRRQSINASKLQYLQYIQDLLKYFEEKVQSKEYVEITENLVEVENQSKVNKAILELEQIEHSVTNLKEDVDNFIGSKNDNNYNTLDLEINTLMTRVDKLNSMKHKNISLKRKKLLKSLNDVSNNLKDKSSKEFEPANVTIQGRILDSIDQICKELDSLDKEIDNFYGSKNDAIHTRLDEMLIKLFLKLDNIENAGDQQIKTAKQKAMKQIQKSMSTLDQRVKNLMGTEV